MLSKIHTIQIEVIYIILLYYFLLSYYIILLKEYSTWNELPDLLLEEIFKYLTIRERYYASLVS